MFSIHSKLTPIALIRFLYKRFPAQYRSILKISDSTHQERRTLQSSVGSNHRCHDLRIKSQSNYRNLARLINTFLLSSIIQNDSVRF